MATEHSLHRALERASCCCTTSRWWRSRGAATVGVEALHPVGPPRAGAGRPRPVHPRGRGERADHPHRRLGAARRPATSCGAGTTARRAARLGGGQPVGPPDRRPRDRGTVEGILDAHRASARAPDARDHRERPHEATPRPPCVVLRALKELGRAAGHRRLRHRVLVAQLPPAVPPRHPEGGQDVRRRARRRQRGRRDRVGRDQPGPRPRASRWWPRGWRPSGSSRSCGASTATSPRDSCSPGRCRPTSCTRAPARACPS